jgi:2-polyprenyl-3-methyl-5-hydroxy-6-metoxy-1,4-benzoquinol methylase
MRAVINPPADSGEADFDPDRPDWPEYVAGQRGDADIRTDVLDHIRELVEPGPSGQVSVLDVGAGAGDFVALARDRGFDAHGCDISSRGIIAARERHGIEISPLPLGEQPPAGTDSMTMWCVIAHLSDSTTFLDEAFAATRPGGILFLRTPRWCTFDRVAIILARIGPNKLTRMADRRITGQHLRLYTKKSMTRQLSKVGFTDIEVHSECHYPFSSKAYIANTGGKARLFAPLAVVFDWLIEHNLFFRNTVFAYARRPIEPNR